MERGISYRCAYVQAQCKEGAMNAAVKLTAAILIGTTVSVAAQGQAKLNCVKDVTYNKEFLAKFPDAGSVCQEVKVVNGQKWVRFNAEVKHNKDNHITVDFLNQQQRHYGSPMTLVYTPDATLTLENNKVKAASAIEEGDKVVVWVPESRFGVYAQPGEVESKQFAVVSGDSAAQR
jgi:hypothetical protein